MRAIRARRDGTPDVLTLEEVARPTPDDDQVLVDVRIRATARRALRETRSR